MVSKNRLADKVIERTKAGVRFYEPNPVEKNENRLEPIMGLDSQKIVSSILLDQVEYQVPYFTSKIQIAGTNKFLVTVGRFTIELIHKNATLLTLKITRL